MANYVITGVWKSDNHISHVMLHNHSGNKLSTPGQKMSKDAVIKELKAGKTIVTAKWDYKGVWILGADVDYEKKDGKEYLRSVHNGVITDNLNNLLPMSILVG